MPTDTAESCARVPRRLEYRHELRALMADWCATYTAGHLASRAHRYRPEVHAFDRAFDVLAGRASGTPFRGGDDHARLATTAGP